MGVIHPVALVDDLGARQFRAARPGHAEAALPGQEHHQGLRPPRHRPVHHRFVGEHDPRPLRGKQQGFTVPVFGVVCWSVESSAGAPAGGA
ncbi:MAG TPA: hypothetical protein H9836_18420 [Candidatus Nocardiopsis merdipullorum]|nr:hypothetical protein [Candidatus Nocardiopsis merdipullorum]